MKFIILALLFVFAYHLTHAQKVGIGTNAPVAKLDIRGSISNPSIPGPTSTGIMRIGVSAIEGIDIGKMGSAPFSAWMQAGYNGAEADPLSFQPMGGSVGIGTTNPENSAVLDIHSNSQGFLPPRMSMENRNGIVNPTEGLLIWCTNCGVYGQVQVYNGAIWTGTAGNPSAGTPIIGDSDGGGIVAYIFQPGDAGYIAGETHGLIAKASDEDLASWGCQGTVLPGADGTAIGTGNQNTLDIVNGCLYVGTAAYLCKQLIYNGYDDWYLPSKEELLQLYLHKSSIGGFVNEMYWSSTEAFAIDAFLRDFGTGQSVNGLKDSLWRYRAVRTF